MTEVEVEDLDDRADGRVAEPPDHTADTPSGAVRSSDEPEIAINGDIRVVEGARYWILQTRSGKTWRDDSFCATKEGLLQALKDHLLRLRLEALGAYQPQRVKVPNKNGVLVSRRVVDRGMLTATDAARAQLAAGDISDFGVDPDAWTALMALPDYFPKQIKWLSE